MKTSTCLSSELCVLALLPEPARSCCNIIPSATQTFRGTLGASHVALKKTMVAALACLLLLLAGCSPGDSARGVTTVEAARPGSERPRVTALGRLEPRDGIVRVAGSSRPSVVIAKLLVKEGDGVTADQPIAVLDTELEDTARVARTKVELANAERELARVEPLVRQGIVSASERDNKQLRVDVARADLAGAQATLAHDTVRAPVAGKVIALHAQAGERVGPDGILELAQTDAMYAVAEVYETDIGRVKVGQRATMQSPALEPELTGVVERIGHKVGKLDAIDADPVARTDARVVEVHIRLDDSPRGASLSNLQVEVTIEPSAAR
jgi:HlyD family secretion protein